MRYDDSVLGLVSFMYLLLAFAVLCVACHIPPLIPFSTTTNISASAGNSSQTSVSFKRTCHTNSGANKKYGSSFKFLCIYFGSFQTHLLVEVYHFACTDHNVDLDSVF